MPLSQDEFGYIFRIPGQANHQEKYPAEWRNKSVEVQKHR